MIFMNSTTVIDVNTSKATGCKHFRNETIFVSVSIVT